MQKGRLMGAHSVWYGPTAMELRPRQAEEPVSNTYTDGSSDFFEPVILVLDHHTSQTGRHFVAALDEFNCFEPLWVGTITNIDLQVPKMSTPLSPIVSILLNPNAMLTLLKETFWNVFKHHFRCYNYSVTYETAGCGARDTKAELTALLKQFATPGEPLVSDNPLTKTQNDALKKLCECEHQKVSLLAENESLTDM